MSTRLNYKELVLVKYWTLLKGKDFFKSVPYLRAMCSPKFRTILIKNGRLRAILTSKWRKFCSSRPISHKPFNILFWNITHLFVTSVPCGQPSFGKLEFKIPNLEHFLRSYEIFGKALCTGSAAQIFNCFQICLLPLFLLFSQTFICGGYHCLSDILVLLYSQKQ